MIKIDEQIIEALTLYKKIAVVGLSPEPERPSFGVSQYMQSKGYVITPIRPPGGEIILGEKALNSLSELPKPVEIVDVFRKSEAVPQIVDEAIKVGAKVLWLQEGVLNPLAEERARAAGLLVFSDLCILKEHRRLIKKR
jgi:predicted CoA-binding protein